MTASNMGTTGGNVTFRRYAAVSARRIRAVVEAVYVGSYVDAIASGDPFDSVEAFMHRFDSYTSGSSFDLVVAYHGDDAIGQTWGWPLDESATTTGWWDGLLDEPEPGFNWEDGHRTFALSEIMVLQDWAGKGIAHALHDRLSAGRSSVPLCSSSRTTFMPAARTSIGDGTRWPSCDPDGTTHPCLMY